MAIKITSGGALARMQNAITQANMAFNHNMEPIIKVEWQRITGLMHVCRKLAIEKNEKVEAIKNGKI